MIRRMSPPSSELTYAPVSSSLSNVSCLGVRCVLNLAKQPDDRMAHWLAGFIIGSAGQLVIAPGAIHIAQPASRHLTSSLALLARWQSVCRREKRLPARSSTDRDSAAPYREPRPTALWRGRRVLCGVCRTSGIAAPRTLTATKALRCGTPATSPLGRQRLPP